MGQPARGRTRASVLSDGGAPGELKHLSTLRNRNHRDSVSSGERTRRSRNRPHSVAGKPMCGRGWTAVMEVLAGTSGSHQAVVAGEAPGRARQSG